VASLRDRFAAHVAAGQRCDLAAAALEIATIAYPDLDPAPSLRRLDDLARDAGRRIGPEMSAADAAHELTRFLFEDCGFRGNQDDYYDPRNSFLNDVLDRRLGIPISLSVVMIEIGRRLGLRIEGVGFPGHFLVRIHTDHQPILLDPFHAGTPVDDTDLLARLRALSQSSRGGGPDFAHVPDEFLEAASPRGILGRMLRNLLRIWLEKNEQALALAAVDLLLVLTPHAADDIRTRGFLYEELECPAAAAEDLRRYLDLAPDAPDADEVRGRLSRLADETPTFH
jgi:regulator of sirC expression with transglutaminase-like and TPR domain